MSQQPITPANADISYNFGLPAVFSFEAIRQRLPTLLGETLTVVDASIHDPVARKATKDLIKKSFYRWAGDLEQDAAYSDPDGHGKSRGSINLEPTVSA